MGKSLVSVSFSGPESNIGSILYLHSPFLLYCLFYYVLKLLVECLVIPSKIQKKTKMKLKKKWIHVGLHIVEASTK